ncbi:PIN domain-containing protein [Halorubrum lipolyticum]|uniref:Ribonuclease VapC n=1 Tax=Halorubrum lipolyticum DSM 21995 TaxID=1227482 RepID=M0NZE5_9EURY|nr:PIN domain-containing protein [Halorubrum lipolyticum]EMA63307.1 PilT protein domain-containing protein [Halorubrum lipolyticum DSM 21995]
MKLVDASFLIDYARGDDAAIAYLAAHDEEVIGASTIVLSELYRGLMITQEMTQEEAVSKYEWVEPVPFTNETAAEAAEIYVELRDDGEMINKSDIYIAGTARSLGVPLVVGDNDFGAVSGLDVETYRK